MTEAELAPKNDRCPELPSPVCPFCGHTWSRHRTPKEGASKRAICLTCLFGNDTPPQAPGP